MAVVLLFFYVTMLLPNADDTQSDIGAKSRLRKSAPKSVSIFHTESTRDEKSGWKIGAENKHGIV